MSSTQVTIPSPPEGQDLATVPTKLEVTPLPVSDFECRASPTPTRRRRRSAHAFTLKALQAEIAADVDGGRQLVP